MSADERIPSLAGLVVGGLLPILVAVLLVPLRGDIAGATVALALVATVVLAAVLGGRAAGALAAVMATLSYDFWHTLPYGSLTIDSRDDVETVVLLLVVGLAVGTVAARGRRAERSAQEGRSELQRIHHLAEMVAAGEDPTDVVMAGQDELKALLSLRDCRFEAVPHGPPLPRLERSGAVAGRREYRFGRAGLELPGDGAELPVMGRGEVLGRFVLTPTAGVGASLDQRIVAVALSDQVGAVLAAAGPRPRSPFPSTPSGSRPQGEPDHG